MTHAALAQLLLPGVRVVAGRLAGRLSASAPGRGFESEVDQGRRGLSVGWCTQSCQPVAAVCRGPLSDYGIRFVWNLRLLAKDAHRAGAGNQAPGWRTPTKSLEGQGVVPRNCRVAGAKTTRLRLRRLMFIHLSKI